FADGNNVLDVYAATRLAAHRARAGGGPALLVVETLRLGGHATHDQAAARATVDAALFAYCGRHDATGLYEAYLTGVGIARARLEAIEADVPAEVERAAERALASRESAMPAPESAEYEGVSAGVRQPGLAWRLG